MTQCQSLGNAAVRAESETAQDVLIEVMGQQSGSKLLSLFLETFTSTSVHF